MTQDDADHSQRLACPARGSVEGRVYTLVGKQEYALDTSHDFIC